MIFIKLLPPILISCTHKWYDMRQQNYTNRLLLRITLSFSTLLYPFLVICNNSHLYFVCEEKMNSIIKIMHLWLSFTCNYSPPLHYKRLLILFFFPEVKFTCIILQRIDVTSTLRLSKPIVLTRKRTKQLIRNTKKGNDEWFIAHSCFGLCFEYYA